MKALQLHPSVARLVASRDKIKKRLTDALFVAQSTCPHEIVMQAPYAGSGLPAVRICPRCRLQERGTHWSDVGYWNKEDFETASLGNREGRVVTVITRDEFYAMRLS